MDTPFSEHDDDREVLLDLFRALDTDCSNSISISELRAATSLYSLQGNSELCAIFEGMIEKWAGVEKNDDGTIQISFEEFSEVFSKLPRVSGERVKWAGSLGLDGELARLLMKGNPFDGLKGLRDLEGAELDSHITDVCSRFGAVLPGLLRRGLSKLKASGQLRSSVQDHINSKFVLDGAYVGRFTTLDDFYRGPEALIGVPNPRIFEGAEKEHCDRSNASLQFTTSNYNITTRPKLEWEFVVCPVDDAPEYRRYPHTPKDPQQWMRGNEWKGRHGRDIIPLETVLEDEDVKVQVAKARLLREEVICLRLYTGQCTLAPFSRLLCPVKRLTGDAGPMFVLYNAALRDFPWWDVEKRGGNKYETTIFVIASGITKLSKVISPLANRGGDFSHVVGNLRGCTRRRLSLVFGAGGR